MPEIVLQRSGVDAVVGQLIATGVPQHVRVHDKLELSSRAQARHHLTEAGRGKRRAALGHEHERRFWALSLELTVGQVGSEFQRQMPAAAMIITPAISIT